MSRKRKRERKKVVLFLVEGETEITALSESMVDIFEEIDPEIIVCFCLKQEYDRKEDRIKYGGDITSKYGIEPDNIERLISDLFVYPFYQENHYFPKDISRIIHIVDTDGMHIPDEAILEANWDKVHYFDEHIEARNTDEICERNNKKRANIDHLIKIKTIKVESKTIPYRLYFMSCNLDHFLGGGRNMADLDKIALAESFADRCADDPDLFSRTLLADRDFVDCSWEESWKKISVGKRSLEAHSNLGQLLLEIRSASKE